MGDVLAWLLSRLPSVRAERELAVLAERIAADGAALVDLRRQLVAMTGERDAYRRKYDRLAENRLFRTGDISERLTDPPASTRPNAPSVFANLGHLVNTTTAARELEPVLPGAPMSS